MKEIGIELRRSAYSGDLLCALLIISECRQQKIGFESLWIENIGLGQRLNQLFF
jgi:hypothetical protein